MQTENMRKCLALEHVGGGKGSKVETLSLLPDLARFREAGAKAAPQSVGVGGGPPRASQDAPCCPHSRCHLPSRFALKLSSSSTSRS